MMPVPPADIWADAGAPEPDALGAALGCWRAISLGGQSRHDLLPKTTAFSSRSIARSPLRKADCP